MLGVFKKAFLPVNLAVRCQEISWTLTRYGVAGNLASLGLELGRTGWHRVQPKSAPAKPLDSVFGANLAQTFQALGPTFIKLGQVLATRPDFLGEGVSNELRVLFDRVDAIPISEVKKILKKEWGRNFRDTLKHLDPKPLGSASIGQTHRATLADGTEVIVKVQKPGVERLVKLDLLLLQGLVTPLNPLFPMLGLKDMFQDFRDATLREIDYVEEANNLKRFQKNYSGLFQSGGVLFPKVFEQLTTSRVLVMTPMRGEKIGDLKPGSKGAKAAAGKSLAAILEQIFDHGFFHADPHGANIFFAEEQGTIGFIDLGLVGQLTAEDKRKFLKVLFAILHRDRKALAKSLYELGVPGAKTDLKKFDSDIQALLDEVKAQGVATVKLEKLLNQLLVTARKNGIFIPNRYVLMMRSCLIIEGVAKGLDPQLNLVHIALPIITKSLMKSLNPLRRIFGR